MKIAPFKIAVGDDQLQDLRTRLRRTRWPDALPGMDWADGTDLGYLRDLAAYWEAQFDWRAQEARLNELPQYMARVDDLDIHFIHQRGRDPDPFPLVLTHGYPGTGFDMEALVSLLADPAAHGGDPADAFDVVAPSLPGYGFSQRPARTGVGPARTAELWRALMAGLGYGAFGAYGTDWGAAVSIWLARRYPDDVSGLHLSFIPGRFRPALGDGQPPITDAEQAFLDKLAAWFASEGGYHSLQSTKPQTPAYALNDSPAGLAAWIVEKNRDWSQSGGDVETVFSRDQLLTNISIYWFSQTIVSAMRYYWEDRRAPTTFRPGERIRPPLGMAAMPKEADVTPPRSWVERVFDVERWTRLPHGGHFGPQEAPNELAQEIRAFFRPVRATTASGRR